MGSKIFGFREVVGSLPVYNAGLSEEAVRRRYGLDEVVKLASNECAFGVSPAVVRCLRDVGANAFRYPDPYCTELRAALALEVGVRQEQLLFGNGSEEIIHFLCVAALSPGERVLTLAPSFGLHEIYPRMMGATVEKVSVTAALEFDIDAWERALARPTRMAMFSVPSNPVGCTLSRADCERLVAAAPADTILVIDEAYREFVAAPQRLDLIGLLSAQSRPWVLLRTFSKAYALGGLRIGYAIVSDGDAAMVLDRVRPPFNVNRVAQLAALAALQDRDHLEYVVASTQRERAWLRENLLALDGRLGCGLRIAPSHGNFLLLGVRQPGAALAQRLLHAGVIVKGWTEAGYEDFVRVSVGSRAQNTRFLEAFDAALDGAPA